MSQTVGSTTTIYPNKFYSITSTTIGANTYATTTVYVWNGDTLIATIDQPLFNGSATGTAATRYIHADHLGSTNIVSDESGNIVGDYETYPYGETRINQTTYPTKENRRFIGQFSDANNLQYLNARYLNSQQGQFLSENPVFLSLGSTDQVQQLAQQDQSRLLSDPQQLNAYSYGRDNPVVNKDPKGTCFEPASAIACALVAYSVTQIAVDYYDYQITHKNYPNTPNMFSPTEKSQSTFKFAYDVGTSLTGLSAEKVGLKVLGNTLDALSVSLDALDQTYGTQIYQADTDLHKRSPNSPYINLLNPNSSYSAPTAPKSSQTSNQSRQQGGQQSSGSYSQLVSSLSQLVTSLSALLTSLRPAH